MNDAFVSVGSNIDAAINIPLALRRLKNLVNVRTTSTFYRTEDVQCSDRPKFSNGVWHILVEHNPFELKRDILRKVEADLGRNRAADRYSPRTIDLDLILYGDRVIHTENLTLPDPNIRTRSFIAVPLLELAPDLLLPDTGSPLSALQSAHDRSLHVLGDLTETLQEIIKM